MRYIILQLLAAAGITLAGFTLEKRAACNADNCARLVTGTTSIRTVPNSSSRSKDCVSFLATTVVPSPSIATTTVTLSSGQVAPSPSSLVTTAQTIAPSRVPTYVSNSCGTDTTSTSRYSSACACFPGVTASTTVASQPTLTTTIYATPTAPTTVCYNLLGVSGDGSAQALAASLTVANDRPCSYDGSLGGAVYTNGATVIGASGLYNGQIITFDSTQTVGLPDYCLFSNSPHVFDYRGTVLIAGGTAFNFFNSAADPSVDRVLTDQGKPETSDPQIILTLTPKAC